MFTSFTFSNLQLLRSFSQENPTEGRILFFIKIFIVSLQIGEDIDFSACIIGNYVYQPLSELLTVIYR